MHLQQHRWTSRLSYWMESDRKRQISYDRAYMWNEKKVQVNLSAKQSYRCRKQTNVYQGIQEGGINWEIRSDMYTALLIHTKQITNKDPLYNTGGASKVVLVVKNLPANAGHVRDTGLILGLGRSPGGGTGRPLQYSCLENRMGSGAWWATAHVWSQWVRHDWSNLAHVHARIAQGTLLNIVCWLIYRRRI